MQENEPEQFHQHLWTSQEKEPMNITIEEVCARARSDSRTNVRLFWAVAGVAPLLIAAFVYDLARIREPWIVAGIAWALGVFCYFLWIVLRDGPRNMVEAEPCVDFLRRQFEGKRKGTVDIRRGVVLCIPAILAVWWGGGPVLRAKALGVQSGTVLGLLKGPAPLVVLGLLLALVWLAMAHEARRIDRELEKLGRR